MKSIFPKLQANESFIMACLQIYRELLNLTTFSQSSLKLKRVILLLLPKYVSQLENYLSYQAKIFLLN